MRNLITNKHHWMNAVKSVRCYRMESQYNVSTGTTLCEGFPRIVTNLNITVVTSEQWQDPRKSEKLTKRNVLYSQFTLSSTEGWTTLWLYALHKQKNVYNNPLSVL